MAACIFIIFINLCMNLVVGLNVFGILTPSPLLNSSAITTIESGGETFVLASILTNNLLSIISVSASSALFLIITLNCIRTGSYAILGPVLFTLVFWNSWVTNISFLGTSGYFSIGAMLTILGIITIAMLLLFLGAISGMLSGGE